MTDIGERLHAIRAHLRTGALGQREVWEDWLTEAAADIKRLFAAIQRIDGINDNPAHYNPDINAVCDPILRPKP